MMEQVMNEHTLNFDHPVAIETNATGGLVIVMRRVPVKFEQVFDPEKFTWTMRAIWLQSEVDA